MPHTVVKARTHTCQQLDSQPRSHLGRKDFSVCVSVHGLLGWGGDKRCQRSLLCAVLQRDKRGHQQGSVAGGHCQAAGCAPLLVSVGEGALLSSVWAETWGHDKGNTGKTPVYRAQGHVCVLSESGPS